MFLLFVTATIAVAATAPRGVAGAKRTAKRDRQVLRFFEHHGWLLTDPRFSGEAKRQIRAHRRSLASAQRVLASARRARARHAGVRKLAEAVPEPASATICRVFGAYCGEALQVARCESGLQTAAQNGQYLGLFQMGSEARRLYGHGETAERQARAAHRYFVASGRDWSPWTCRPR
jgi:hypothetical protein